MRYEVRNIKSVNGEITVPGDKSISHRAVMLGSMAEGATEIHNFSTARDCTNTIDCMRNCGIDIDIKSPNMVIVHGKGLRGLKKPSSMLYAGNSGTTIRLMAGILCGQRFDSSITGDSSLIKRPMDRIIRPLRTMGARIEGGSGSRYAPLTIMGSALSGIEYNMPVASAQVKSAILLASMYAEGRTVIIEPIPSRDHTEIMLKRFGADVCIDGPRITATSAAGLMPQVVDVPGDISSASNFIVAAAIIPGSKLVIRNVGINAKRAGIIYVLKSMGASIEIENMYCNGGEPVADISVRSSTLKGVGIEGELIPTLIDEIPVLCIAGAFAHGTTIISGAGELRYKESNRINAMVSNLKLLGADVEEKDDGILIHGNGGKLHGNIVNSFDDHRIVMAMAITGMALDTGLIIDDIRSVGISFPEFFKTVESLYI